MEITKKMNFCSGCGIKLPGKIRNYCTSCGTRLVKQEKINCGANLVKKRGNQRPIGKCTICHKTVYSKDNIVKCAFCDSKYHYSCVASWISKHNACPMCFNVYLTPEVEVLIH